MAFVPVALMSMTVVAMAHVAVTLVPVTFVAMAHVAVTLVPVTFMTVAHVPVTLVPVTFMAVAHVTMTLVPVTFVAVAHMSVTLMTMTFVTVAFMTVAFMTMPHVALGLLAVALMPMPLLLSLDSSTQPDRDRESDQECYTKKHRNPSVHVNAPVSVVDSVGSCPCRGRDPATHEEALRVGTVGLPGSADQSESWAEHTLSASPVARLSVI